MKKNFKNIVKEYGYLNEQVSNITPTSGEKIDSMGGEIKNNFKGTLDGELIDFTFKGGEGDDENIKNVKISFRDKEYTLNFIFDEIVHEDEDIHEAIFLAKSDDGMWDFEMTVQVDKNFESGQCNPCIIEYPYEMDGNSGTYLKITKAEDPRGDSEDGGAMSDEDAMKAAMYDAPDGLFERKILQTRAGIIK